LVEARIISNSPLTPLYKIERGIKGVSFKFYLGRSKRVISNSPLTPLYKIERGIKGVGFNFYFGRSKDYF